MHEATGRIAGATVAYVGDGNNVCASWLYGAAITGVRLSMVCPPGYEPPPDVLERAATLRTGEATFTLTHDPRVALRDAEVVYTDVWTSMGQEQEQQRRREDFAHLQVNDALVALAAPGARVMHCLPAHRGEEITDTVIDGPSSIVFDQAENRMWVQLALLARIFGVEGVAGAGTGATGEARVGAASVSQFITNAHVFVQSLGWRDLVDIAVVALLLYQLLKLIRGTQAAQLLVGIGVLCLLGFLAQQLHLRLLEYIFATAARRS